MGGLDGVGHAHTTWCLVRGRRGGLRRRGQRALGHIHQRLGTGSRASIGLTPMQEVEQRQLGAEAVGEVVQSNMLSLLGNLLEPLDRDNKLKKGDKKIR